MADLDANGPTDDAAPPTELAASQVPAPQEDPPSATMSVTAQPVRPPSNRADDAGGDLDDEDDDSTPRMSIGDHLDDLRRRLFRAVLGLAAAMVVGLVFGERILGWIEYPYRSAMWEIGKKPDLAVFSITGAFTMYMRVAFYAGLILASPWVFYQLWMFVAAGLYRKERRYVSLALPFSVALFICGAAAGIAMSIPAIKFFIQFGNGMGVDPIISLNDYVDFLTQLLLVFGLVFQVPLVVLVLARVGLVDMRKLNRYRRHVIVGMAVIAAIFAPPDAVSMIVMMLPMCLLYELGIVLAWLLIFRKRPAPATADSDIADADDDDDD
jgi:sec-independent protein translocase protein TatC